METSERQAMKKATTAMKKSGAKEGKGGHAPSALIDARIKELSDWRGETLARVRTLIKQADPEVVEEWLMKNDFTPVVGHRFDLRADWGSVECRVLAVEPNKTLSYTWGAYGLDSVVTWTLTPTSTGTHLRMEQSGFRPDQQQAYQGAKHGWPQFFANLEQVLARIAT